MAWPLAWLTRSSRWPAVQLFALDQSNVARWLDQLKLEPTARMLVNQRIRARYDEPSRLSLLYLVQQARCATWRGRR